MGLLFMARPNSYKTRRQLVHGRIDVVTTQTNVVISPSYLVQNSQITHALLYRFRDYSKNGRSKPVISGHYTVLCRSKSYGIRNKSHYVAMVDRRPRAPYTREPTPKLCTRTVRQSTGELRDQYEKNSAHLDAELWRDF